MYNSKFLIEKWISCGHFFIDENYFKKLTI